MLTRTKVFSLTIAALLVLTLASGAPLAMRQVILSNRRGAAGGGSGDRAEGDGAGDGRLTDGAGEGILGGKVNITAR